MNYVILSFDVWLCISHFIPLNPRLCILTAQVFPKVLFFLLHTSGTEIPKWKMPAGRCIKFFFPGLKLFKYQGVFHSQQLSDLESPIEFYFTFTAVPEQTQWKGSVWMVPCVVLSSVMGKDRNSTDFLILFPSSFLLSASLYSHFLLGLSTVMTLTITDTGCRDGGHFSRVLLKFLEVLCKCQLMF